MKVYETIGFAIALLIIPTIRLYAAAACDTTVPASDEHLKACVTDSDCKNGTVKASETTCSYTKYDATVTCDCATTAQHLCVSKTYGEANAKKKTCTGTCGGGFTGCSGTCPDTWGPAESLKEKKDDTNCAP
jgi:hypothetical protein